LSPFKIVITFVFISIVGILLIPQLSIELNPRSNLPKFTISYSLPNSSAQIVEQEGTSNLENLLSQISGINKIHSISKENNGLIEITFNLNTDIEFKRFEISSLIRQIYPKLHKDLSYPVLELNARKEGDKRPLLLYHVTSDLSYYQLGSLINHSVIPELSRVSGVRDIKIDGVSNVELVVEYDMTKLTMYNLTTKKISQSILQECSSFTSGSFTSSSGSRLIVKVDNDFNNISEIQDILLPAMNKGVRLRDVAEVYLSESIPEKYQRVNGKNSICIYVYPDKGVNTIIVARNLKQSISKLKNSLSDDTTFFLEYDDTDFLTREVSKNYVRIEITLLLLLLLTLIWFKSLRHFFVLVSVILVNLSLTAFVTYVFDISLDIFKVSSLTFFMGMALYSSIVRLIPNSNSDNLTKATLSGALVLIFSVSLILLLPEERRQSIDQFSIMVAISISCSLIVGVFFAPSANQLFLNFKNRNKYTQRLKSGKDVYLFSKYTSLISFISRYRRGAILVIVLSTGIPTFLLPERLEGNKLYNRVFGSTFYQKKIKGISDAIFGGSMRVFFKNRSIRHAYGDPQRTKIFIKASLPSGNTLSQMNDLMIKVEDYLKSVDHIDMVITKVFSGQDAGITILFDKVDGGETPYVVKNKLIAYSLNWGGVEWEIFGVGEGFSNRMLEEQSTFIAEIHGYNYDELNSHAEVFASYLKANNRIKNINTRKRLGFNEKTPSYYTIRFNESNFGGQVIPFQELLSSLRDQNSPSTKKLNVPFAGNHIQIKLKPTNKDSLSTFEVMHDMVRVNELSLKLSDYASLKQVLSPSAVEKIDRQYVQYIGFEYLGNYEIGREYLYSTINKMSKELPLGYEIKESSWGGQVEDRDYRILFVFLLGAFLFCLALLEDLKKSICVIAMVPISFIGPFLVFGIFDVYYDQGGFSSFLISGGVSISMSILMIYGAKPALNQRSGRANFKFYAVRASFVLLLAASLFSSMLPFVIEGQKEAIWYALALGSLGGIVFSVMSAIVLLPSFLLTSKSKVQSGRI
jgi:multidrug efflux pump subunit AcrB